MEYIYIYEKYVLLKVASCHPVNSIPNRFAWKTLKCLQTLTIYSRVCSET